MEEELISKLNFNEFHRFKLGNLLIKNELLNKLRNFDGFHPAFLYQDLIVLEKTSNFNEVELNKFVITFCTISCETSTSLSPQLITEMQNKMQNKLNQINSRQLKKLNTLKSHLDPNWIGVRLPKKNSNIRNSNEKTEDKKIYLSVDNNSLHKFANQFILLCIKYGYSDFEFKINNDESMNRGDNVVIYCTDKTFDKYVSLVQEVIKSNPQIVFNQPHLLAIPYDEHIFYGFDFDNGKTSYSERLCESIFMDLGNGKIPKEIVDAIENFKRKEISSIHDMGNMTSNVSIKH